MQVCRPWYELIRDAHRMWLSRMQFHTCLTSPEASRWLDKSINLLNLSGNCDIDLSIVRCLEPGLRLPTEPLEHHEWQTLQHFGNMASQWRSIIIHSTLTPPSLWIFRFRDVVLDQPLRRLLHMTVKSADLGLFLNAQLSQLVSMKLSTESLLHGCASRLPHFNRVANLTLYGPERSNIIPVLHHFNQFQSLRHLIFDFTCREDDLVEFSQEVVSERLTRLTGAPRLKAPRALVINATSPMALFIFNVVSLDSLQDLRIQIFNHPSTSRTPFSVPAGHIKLPLLKTLQVDVSDVFPVEFLQQLDFSSVEKLKVQETFSLVYFQNQLIKLPFSFPRLRQLEIGGRSPSRKISRQVGHLLGGIEAPLLEEIKLHNCQSQSSTAPFNSWYFRHLKRIQVTGPHFPADTFMNLHLGGLQELDLEHCEDIISADSSQHLEGSLQYVENVSMMLPDVASFRAFLELAVEIEVLRLVISETSNFSGLVLLQDPTTAPLLSSLIIKDSGGADVKQVTDAVSNILLYRSLKTETTPRLQNIIFEGFESDVQRDHLQQFALVWTVGYKVSRRDLESQWV
jgi:hypothetical protein